MTFLYIVDTIKLFGYQHFSTVNSDTVNSFKNLNMLFITLYVILQHVYHCLVCIIGEVYNVLDLSLSLLHEYLVYTW